MAEQAANCARVFISYAHKDQREPWLERLNEHLAGLRRKNLIAPFEDRMIAIGKEWDATIRRKLDESDLILLLISPSFVGSWYCNEVEVERALARHRAGETKVMPVVIMPCDWEEEPFAKVQAFPRPGPDGLVPLSMWNHPDDGLAKIAREIRVWAREFCAKTATARAQAQLEAIDVETEKATLAQDSEIIRKMYQNIDLSPPATPQRNVSGTTGVVSPSVPGRFSEMLAAIQEHLEVVEHRCRAAEAAHEARSLFLASMAHDIREPLNGVLGMNRILRETQLSSEQRGYLEDMYGTSDAVLRIVNDVLDLLRMEAGRLTLETGDFDLESVLDGARRIVEPKATARGVAVLVNVTPGALRNLRGDSSRMRQIIVNILETMIMFTHNANINVQAELDSVLENSGQVRLAVKIEGSATYMPEHIRDRVFDPLIKWTENGLSLVISRLLVRIMGGGLEIEHLPNGGIIFRFTVLLGATQQSRTLRILVADGHSVSARLPALLLERTGHKTDIVSDGNAAVAAASGGRYDLIFMEMQLPELDGLDATRRIREISGTAGTVPIIALTAHAMRGDRERCLAAGMNDYMSKPVDRMRLLEVVAAWGQRAGTATCVGSEAYRAE